MACQRLEHARAKHTWRLLSQNSYSTLESDAGGYVDGDDDDDHDDDAVKEKSNGLQATLLDHWAGDAVPKVRAWTCRGLGLSGQWRHIEEY